MNILISGGTGFVGYNLIKRLVGNGHAITSIIRPNSNIEKLNGFNIQYISFEEIKKSDIDFYKFDVVYHLAGIRHKWGTSWNEYVKSGQEYTEMLLKSSVGKITQFIFCSSVAVYGYTNTLPISENSEKNPHNLYGKMKLECENLVMLYNEKYDLPYTILRPSIVYGENDPQGMMTRLVKMIYNNSYHTIGNGNNRIQCVYIEDFIDILEKIGTNFHPTNEDFIISYKYPITINDLVKLIKNELHKKVILDIKIPEWLARFFAMIIEKSYHFGIKLTGPEPIIAQEKVDTMVKDVVYDISKIENACDFVPEVSYKQGINRLIYSLAQENKWKV
jgi:nucleoside-diphosphate-sugar epimerase